MRLLVVLLALSVLGVAGWMVFEVAQSPWDGTPRTAAERALLDARQAIEDDPRDVDARIQLARVQIGLGQTESALRTLDAAEEIDPGNLLIEHLRGVALLESGDAIAALAHLEAATGLEGGFGHEYAVIFSDLGRARMLTGDPEGAADAYEQALTFSPQAADIVFELATVYEQLGLTEEAVRAYGGVLSFLPDHEGARSALVRLGVAVDGGEGL